MQALRAQWFNDTYGPRRANLQDYHELCTYGKVVWGPDNNLIVGPVQVRDGHCVCGRVQPCVYACVCAAA